MVRLDEEGGKRGPLQRGRAVERRIVELPGIIGERKTKEEDTVSVVSGVQNTHGREVIVVTRPVVFVLARE